MPETIVIFRFRFEGFVVRIHWSTIEEAKDYSPFSIFDIFMNYEVKVIYGIEQMTINIVHYCRWRRNRGEKWKP